MRIDILTLFPDMIKASLHESIIGRAVKKGILEINAVQIRDFTDNRQNQVDDYPYGGGFGCVMMAQPLKACLDHVMESAGGLRTRVIYMSPQGKTYDQETAKRLRRDYDHLVLVCGHYEGVDERFIEQCVDEELSLGNFVLTGGEIAAMAVADSVCRMVPGVLSDEQCYTGESHWDGLLEYPQYTRPEVWEGRSVPEVLLNGNHDRIGLWRRRKQIERTKYKRPDMYEKLNLTDKVDRKIMSDIEKAEHRKPLTMPLITEKGRPEDIPQIMKIVDDARASLGRFNVDQWQGEYPEDKNFLSDMELGQCYVIRHGEDVAAVFALSIIPEPCYDGITDGKWSSDAPYCTIHRSAVSGDYRGGEVARIMMAEAEKMAREWGYKYIRVDTHRGNKPMLNLLKDCGYRYRGNILVEECGHDPHRQAFEKVLKERK